MDVKNVSRIVSETHEGSFGLLPNRLDCIAVLEPGILTYETDTVNYLAIDEGVMVKTGADVFVSIRNATGGTDLGKLRESVEKNFIDLDEKERKIRSVMAKLESGFIYRLEKFRKG